MVSRLWVLLLVVAASVVPARAWEQIQTGVEREPGECVSWSPGRIDCFVRLSNGALSWTYREHDVWSTPRELGGKLAGSPSCVVRGPAGINCFAASYKGVLAEIHLNGKVWSEWSSLGGDIAPGRVSCISSARDRMACYARGREGQLMKREWRGGKAWDPWRDMGGSLGGDPDCIIVGGGNTACFARSSQGELAAFLPDATGKAGGWTSLGGRVEGRPSCVRLRSGEATCVARSRSGRLHIWRGMPLYAESNGITSSTDEAIADEPSCALDNATLVCFARNMQRRLVRRTFGASTDVVGDGLLDAPQVASVSCLSRGEQGIGCIVADANGKLFFAEKEKLLAAMPANTNAVAANAPRPSAETESGDAEGTWFLSSLSGDGLCRVTLTGELAYGARRLHQDPGCRDLGLPQRAVQWDQDEGELVFLSPVGRPLVRFRATETGRWISPRRSAAYLLTREPPNDVPNLNATGGPEMAAPLESEALGRWRVVADGAGYVCNINLAPDRVGAGHALHLDGCDRRFNAVRYWVESGSTLVFVGPGDIVLARFDASGPGQWYSRSLGGMMLTR